MTYASLIALGVEVIGTILKFIARKSGRSVAEVRKDINVELDTTDEDLEAAEKREREAAEDNSGSAG